VRPRAPPPTLRAPLNKGIRSFPARSTRCSSGRGRISVYLQTSFHSSRSPNPFHPHQSSTLPANFIRPVVFAGRLQNVDEITFTDRSPKISIIRSVCLPSTPPAPLFRFSMAPPDARRTAWYPPLPRSTAGGVAGRLASVPSLTAWFFSTAAHSCRPPHRPPRSPAIPLREILLRPPHR
jgi:hypothetical protein